MRQDFILREDDLKNLFDKFFKSLCSCGCTFTNDSEISLEIVQNCFVELWNGREKLSHAGNLKSYLYSMVRNDCISHLRKKVKHEGLHGLASENFLETNIIKWETVRILYDAIEELSPQGRQVIYYSLDGLSNQEIAGRLGVSVNSVHTVKKRAYKRLKELLKDHYYILLLILS